MKKQILLTAMILFVLSAPVWAQVHVGSDSAPNDNAVLEVSATDKGFLAPRVALTSTTAAAPLADFVAGMLVYNTATTGDVKPGFYYSDGSKWFSVSAGELSGDLSGTTENATVSKIQGKTVNAGNPTDQQVIYYNATAGQWTLGTLSDLEATTVIPTATTSTSGTITLGGDLIGTGTQSGTPRVSGLQGKPISTTAPTTNQVLVFDGTTWVPATIASDNITDETIVSADIKDGSVATADILDETIESADIKDYTIKPIKLDTVGARSNYVLVFDATLNAWTPKAAQTVQADGDDWGQDVVNHDATLDGAGTSALPLKIKDGGVATTQLADNAVTTEKIANGTIAAEDLSAMGATTDGQVLTYNSGAWAAATPASVSDASTTATGKVQLAGDLGGTNTSPTAPKVSGLQGVTVSATTPATGEVLTYDGATWSPAALPATDFLNGLSYTAAADPANANVKLGGTLTEEADINAASGNFLKLTGLNSADITSTPNVLMAETDGTVKTIAASTLVPNATDLVIGKVRLAGDLAGQRMLVAGATEPSSADVPYVSGLQGVPVANTTPTAGQVLTYDGTTDNAWEPTALPISSSDNGLTTTTGVVELGGALTKATAIDDANFNLTISGGTGKVGIGSAAPTEKLEVVGTTKSTNYASGTQTITGAWDLSLGSSAAITLTANTATTLTLTNAKEGMFGALVVTQDGTGGGTIEFADPATNFVINSGAGVPEIAAAAGAVSVLCFYFDGTNYYWTVGSDYTAGTP